MDVCSALRATGTPGLSVLPETRRWALESREIVWLFSTIGVASELGGRGVGRNVVASAGDCCAVVGGVAAMGDSSAEDTTGPCSSLEVMVASTGAITAELTATTLFLPGTKTAPETEPAIAAAFEKALTELGACSISDPSSAGCRLEDDVTTVETLGVRADRLDG